MTADRPLAIVQLSTADIGGGAEKVAFSLHRLYREMGHRSLLVVGQKRSDDPGVLALDNSGRRGGLGLLRSAASRLLGWQDINHPGSHRLRELVGIPWDVLHAHNLHGSYFDLAALPALSRLAPTVLTLQDNWLQTGHCAYYFDCGRWRTGCGQCQDLAIYPGITHDGTRFNWRRKQRLLSKSRLWLTAPSQWLLDEARESLLAGHPMRLLPNCVDLEAFSPGSRSEARAALKLPAEAPMVAFSATGALTNPFKDGPTLLAALARLVARVPGVVLVALGGGEVPKELSSVAGSVIVRPYERDERRVALYYRAADVMAHAARVDNAPLVVIEAQACGLPVVASRVGGIPEHVIDGQTGRLVPPGDSEALAAALQAVLSDHRQATELAKAALERVKARHDIRAQARELVSWYSELIAGEGRS